VFQLDSDLQWPMPSPRSRWRWLEVRFYAFHFTKLVLETVLGSPALSVAL